jgi:bacterioferritin-associated ferredoxin
MIACHCNMITESDVEKVVLDFLESDPWQLIVPNKVYHELGKRGKCCCCFPTVIDVIVRTTRDFHSRILIDDRGKFLSLMAKLDDMKSRLTANRKRAYVA